MKLKRNKAKKKELEIRTQTNEEKKVLLAGKREKKDGKKIR